MTLPGRRYDQSAISRKEHVKYEATHTYLPVTYQYDRLHLTGKRPQQRSQGPQQQPSTPSTHVSKESSRGKKKHQTMRYVSRKEHVKYEATQTYLPITYQYDRLHLTGTRPEQRSQGPQQQQSTPSTHVSKETSRGTKTLNNAIRGRMHATTGFFRGYCLLTTTFERRRLATGGTCIVQPSRPRGRSHSQCCCVAFPGAVIVITTTPSSFSHACACHVYIHVCMYAYLPKFNKQTHYYYYDPYRSTMGIF